MDTSFIQHAMHVSKSSTSTTAINLPTTHLCIWPTAYMYTQMGFMQVWPTKWIPKMTLFVPYNFGHQENSHMGCASRCNPPLNAARHHGSRNSAARLVNTRDCAARHLSERFIDWFLLSHCVLTPRIPNWVIYVFPHWVEFMFNSHLRVPQTSAGTQDTEGWKTDIGTLGFESQVCCSESSLSLSMVFFLDSITRQRKEPSWSKLAPRCSIECLAKVQPSGHPKPLSF